jgi:hypothetical protein
MARTRIKSSDIEDLTISAEDIADNSISNAKLIDLDASKLTGIIPFDSLSNGELGFLNQTNWPDDTTKSITLIKDAQAIGKIIVKVYEEIIGSVEQQNISNINDWDIVTNDQGFTLQDYSDTLMGITPAATSGTDIEFTFDNIPDFIDGAYTDAVGYKITNLSGTGVARIKSTDGLVAICDIDESFPNTDRLAPGSFKLEAGEFVDGNFVLSSSPNESIIDFVGLGVDIGGWAENVRIGRTDARGLFKMIPLDDQRAVRVLSRTGGDCFNPSESHEYAIRIIQNNPDTSQNPNNQESIFEPTRESAQFPIYRRQLISDVDICYLSEGGDGPGGSVVIVGSEEGDPNSSDGGELKAVIARIDTPSTAPAGTNQSMTIGSETTASILVSASGTITKNAKIYSMSSKHFYVTWQQKFTLLDGSGVYSTYGKTGYMDSVGNLQFGAEHILLGSLDPTLYLPTAAGQVNKPLLHFFKHSETRRDFCYIYYRDDGSPYAIHGVIDGFDSNTDGPSGTYSLLPLLSPLLGCFRDSANVPVPNVGGGNRISTGDYEHWISPVNNDKAVYFWKDSVLGVESCVVSLAPDAGGDTSSQTTTRPLFFGDYFSGADTDISIKGGPAQNITSLPAGAMSGTVYNTTTQEGYYQYSDYSNGIPGQQTAAQVIYGTFKINSTTVVKTSPSLSYDVLGPAAASGVVALSNSRLVSTHQHNNFEFYAKVRSFSPLGFVSDEFVTTISGSDSLNTTNFTNLLSITGVGENILDSAFFSFSDNPTIDPTTNEIIGGTFFISQGLQPRRNIATSLSSLHGGTEGDWFFNNSTTSTGENWVRASADNIFIPLGVEKNSAIVAINLALKENFAENNMNLDSLNTASTAEGTSFTWPALGDRFVAAITIKTTNNSITPKVDKLTLLYDAFGVVQRDKTQDYIIDILSNNEIEVTSPSSGGPRNARVFITS